MRNLEPTCMNESMINLGTAERPVLVPQCAIGPDSDESREFWEMVANRLVDLGSDEALTKLLELRKQSIEKNEIK